MEDGKDFQTDVERWSSLQSSFNNQVTTQQGGLDSPPLCPSCSQPLPHGPMPPRINQATGSYLAEPEFAWTLDSTHERFQDIGDRLSSTRNNTLAPDLDVSGLDQLRIMEGQTSLGNQEPIINTVQPSITFDEHESSMPTPTSNCDMQLSALDTQNELPVSQIALGKEMSNANSQPNGRSQRHPSNLDPALMSPLMQSLPEWPVSPPNECEWPTSSFVLESDFSQNSLLDANSSVSGSAAGYATRTLEVGPSQDRTAPNETVSERSIKLRSDSIKTTGKGREILAGSCSHRCAQCEIEFSREVDLRRHCRTHLRPHQCPKCLRGFAFEKDLARHERTRHSFVRPFKCHIAHCQYAAKGFKRKDNLSRHLRTRHPGCPM